MKASKIFITSLVVAGTLLTAGTTFAESNTITLDSILKNTSDTSQASVSAWDAVVDKASGNITATGINGKANGNYQTVQTGNNSTNAKGITLANLFGYTQQEAGSSFLLTDFSFILRSDLTSNNASKPTPLQVQIKKTDGTVVATSDSTTMSYTNNNSKYKGATLKFTNGAILDWDTEYKFYFGTEDNNSFTQTAVGQGVFTPASGWTIDGTDAQHHSIIRLTGTAVPEPSMFGVLAGLGALALVGSRRRRK